MNRTQLNAQIAQIKNATSIGENTAERIGTVLESLTTLIFDEAFQGAVFRGSETTKIAEVNSWLDDVSFANTESDLKKIGRCKIYVEGVNLEVYNFVLSWASEEGSQMVFGNVGIVNNGNNIAVGGGNFNIIYRYKQNKKWGKWLYVTGVAPTQQDAAYINVGGKLYEVDREKAIAAGLYKEVSTKQEGELTNGTE